MRTGRSDFISWAMAVLVLLSTAAYAGNEKEGIDMQKLLSTTDVTLYNRMGQLVDMNEENFFKKSCIYKAADRDKILALVRIINFSRFEKNISIMARPDWSEVNQDVWKSSSYAVKLNFSDNTSAWLMLESESLGGYGWLLHLFTGL